MKTLNKLEIERVVVRFAGDSGDGIQLMGHMFAESSAKVGNDLVTFPDYPAEIRAPQGTVSGVSSYQIQIGQVDVHTPGDEVDVLVALNPAALKANLKLLRPGGIIIIDMDNMDARGLKTAGYEASPLNDLKDYQIIQVNVTTLTKKGIEHLGLDNKSMGRCKNMFALGMVYWLFSRPLEPIVNLLKDKFKNKPELADANIIAFQAGYSYGETTEMAASFMVKTKQLVPGKYRIISGNVATAWGFLAAAEKTNKEMLLASYPITPATDILHELSKRKGMGIKIFQAEDEIAAIATAIGASFAGDIGITTTSGPGLALKGEAIGLAVMAELPLVIVNVQRGGPSTGLPTKNEQSDLLQALYGRHGESPVPVLAASSPGDCFHYTFEATRLAVEHMTPVIMLSDSYVANSAQPWKIPNMSELPEIKVQVAKENGQEWKPYLRNPETLVRTWAAPGAMGFEHRLGGLEKDDITGNVSYDPLNHEKMVNIRSEKIKRIAQDIPLQNIYGDEDGEILLIGWGGTYGTLVTAVNRLRKEGMKAGLCHFHYINPLPRNTAEIFAKYDKLMVCELNLGQMATYLRTQMPQFNYLQFNKVQGLPFTVNEITNKVQSIIKTALT